jgi:hypothetical protein
MRAVMQLLAFAALGASLLLLVPTADAQGRMSPQPQQAAPSATITDRQLDAAAKAVQRMKTVKETYQKRIDAAAAPGGQAALDERR